MARDQYLVAYGGTVQFVAELGDIAAEALDRFDAEMANRLHGRRGQGRFLNIRKLQQLLEDGRQRKQAARIGDALEVVFALLVQVAGFDEDGPRIGGKVVAEVAGIGDRRAGSVGVAIRLFQGGSQQFNRLKLTEAALVVG